jgi:hypothetical protein
MDFLLNPHNRLFELARLGKRLPHPIVAIIMSLVFVLIAGIGGGIVAVLIVFILSVITGEVTAATLAEITQTQDNQALVAVILPTTALERTIFLVFSFGPIFLLLWVWLALVEKRPFWTIGLEKAGAVAKYLRGIFIGVVMFAAAICISAAFGFIAIEEGGKQLRGTAALAGVLLVLLGWMVQGAAEEAVTRGWLLPVIGARYKPVWGVVVSSLAFMIFHLLNPNLSAIALLNLFLFGMFAALYALYEGGVWGVFSVHAAWNWVQGNVFGFEVSGLSGQGGTLFDLMEVGPDAITGGNFGPEGGLSVTAVLVVSCAIIWWFSRQRSESDQPAPTSESKIPFLEREEQ